MIVVDTNIISYLFLTGEYTNQVKKLLMQDSNWISPILWKSEFRNVLSNYIRKKYINLSEAKILMNEAEHFMRGFEFNINSDQVLDLVNNSDCSAYDCEFVALAKDLHLPLITSDKKIIKAFPKFVYSISHYLEQ